MKVILFFTALNLLTFTIYGIDKWKAIHGYWRISEKTLLLLALAGGSVGALFAMYFFRHKTKHKKFVYGVPGILALQVAAAGWLLMVN